MVLSSSFVPDSVTFVVVSGRNQEMTEQRSNSKDCDHKHSGFVIVQLICSGLQYELTAMTAELC